MACFEGSREGPLPERFARGMEEGAAGNIVDVALDVDPVSVTAWLQLLNHLADGQDPWRAFEIFLGALAARPPRPIASPRVFISHRQIDADYAEQIAWLASRSAGMEYWLDVHDPHLAGIPASHPKYAVLVAAIIEIGLLNCTHVIAAHTPARAAAGATQIPTPWIPSQWIPYEFGRMKARSIYSSQTASWFQSTVHPPEGRGEYVLLADIYDSESDVEAWLSRHAPKPKKLKSFRGSGARRPLD